MMRWYLIGVAILAGMVGTSRSWAADPLAENSLPAKMQGNWCANQYFPAAKEPVEFTRLEEEMYKNYDKCDMPEQTVIHVNTIDDGIRGVCTELSHIRYVDLNTYIVHLIDTCKDGFEPRDMAFHLHDGRLYMYPMEALNWDTGTPRWEMDDKTQ